MGARLNKLPGLNPDDPMVAAAIDRDLLVRDPECVAQVLKNLGEQMRGVEWDLLMIAVPAGKARQVTYHIAPDQNGAL